MRLHFSHSQVGSHTILDSRRFKERLVKRFQKEKGKLVAQILKAEQHRVY